MKIYLASPLGFCEAYKPYMDKVVLKLKMLGHIVHNPWDFDITNVADRKDLLNEIGESNRYAIQTSDSVLAILDGTEPDSGTVSELGYAIGLGKKVDGLRIDSRNVGEFGLPINLQVLYFINYSGGSLIRTIEDIK